MNTHYRTQSHVQWQANIFIMMLELLSISSIKPASQYDAGVYVASVASSLVHNMTLELT